MPLGTIYFKEYGEKVEKEVGYFKIAKYKYTIIDLIKLDIVYTLVTKKFAL